MWQKHFIEIDTLENRDKLSLILSLQKSVYALSKVMCGSLDLIYCLQIEDVKLYH